MILKHTELEILPDQPFANCKLKREPYAEALTTIVTSYADGFVLALNNPWGTGKTTFIKMWQAYLKNKKITTLYFNAWANDFGSDPLVAIMSELKNLNVSSDEAGFEKLLEHASVMAKNVLPGLANAAVAKYLGVNSVADLFENLTRGATEILSEEMKQYNLKKKGMDDFRHQLESYVEGSVENKPLIFFIDELDRCRPDYAVNLLEQIKHLFSVKGIVFVLSIDKAQLENSIRGYYGSDRIDSEEYLRRFIDVEYKIPRPAQGVFTEYLYEYYKFNDFFSHSDRSQYSNLSSDGYNFRTFASELFSHHNLSLRHQEKIFAHARVALRSLKSYGDLFPTVFLLVIFIRDRYKTFYKILNEPRAQIEKISDELKKVIPSEFHGSNERMWLVTEVIFMILYNNCQRLRMRDLIVESDGEKKVLFESIVDISEDKRSVIDAVKHWERRINGNDLNYLLSKIDLLETLEI